MTRRMEAAKEMGRIHKVANTVQTRGEFMIPSAKIAIRDNRDYAYERADHSITILRKKNGTPTCSALFLIDILNDGGSICFWEFVVRKYVKWGRKVPLRDRLLAAGFLRTTVPGWLEVTGLGRLLIIETGFYRPASGHR